MTPEPLNQLVREQEPYIFDRMFSTVEKVRERLDRACRALEVGLIDSTWPNRFVPSLAQRLQELLDDPEG